ncbi:putative kinesin motor protein [Bodo saltans virus]|uniref:Kinesin motor protein n=1 Tax=Bodo saltans virus TaxID=2024608 RepID=A0A2H4UTF7_9VIRU|nr:putative kinesin motor protein [Bodo saltans virus]ATZ80223.1 putative kinesin motor protein [Bodo saltans virus]
MASQTRNFENNIDMLLEQAYNDASLSMGIKKYIMDIHNKITFEQKNNLDIQINELIKIDIDLNKIVKELEGHPFIKTLSVELYILQLNVIMLHLKKYLPTNFLERLLKMITRKIKLINEGSSIVIDLDKKKTFTFEEKKEILGDILNSNTPLKNIEAPVLEILELFANALSNALKNNSQIDALSLVETQYGGGDDVYKIITQSLKELSSKYDIYNIDMMMKIISLFHTTKKGESPFDNASLDGIITNSFVSIKSNASENDFYPLFNDKKDIIKLQTDRDSFFFAEYMGQSVNNKYIFSYNLLQIMYEKSITSMGAEDILQYMYFVKTLANNIVEVYKYLNNIMNEFEISKKINNKIIEISKDDVISIYLRERLDDSGNINKRYNPQILKKDDKNMFVLTYIDTDVDNTRFDSVIANEIAKQKGQPGWDSKKENQIYVHELAKQNSDVMSNILKTNTHDDLHFCYTEPYKAIFDHNKNNDDIGKTEQIKEIIQKVNALTHICIIPDGQSGSGKTSALIYRDGKDGIFPLVCNQVDDSFVELRLQFFRLYVNFSEKLERDNAAVKSVPNLTFDDTDYNIKKMIITQNEQQIANQNGDYILKRESSTKKWALDKKYIEKNGEIVNESTFYLGKLIEEIYKEQVTEPTMNNPESSRAHMIGVVTLSKQIGGDKDITKLCVMDLAGVENIFDCASQQTLNLFLNKIIKLRNPPPGKIPQYKTQVTIDRFEKCEICKTKACTCVIPSPFTKWLSTIPEEQYTDIINALRENQTIPAFDLKEREKLELVYGINRENQDECNNVNTLPNSTGASKDKETMDNLNKYLKKISSFFGEIAPFYTSSEFWKQNFNDIIDKNKYISLVKKIYDNIIDGETIVKNIEYIGGDDKKYTISNVLNFILNIDEQMNKMIIADDTPFDTLNILDFNFSEKVFQEIYNSFFLQIVNFIKNTATTLLYESHDGRFYLSYIERFSKLNELINNISPYHNITLKKEDVPDKDRLDYPNSKKYSYEQDKTFKKQSNLTKNKIIKIINDTLDFIGRFNETNKSNIKTGNIDRKNIKNVGTLYKALKEQQKNLNIDDIIKNTKSALITHVINILDINKIKSIDVDTNDFKTFVSKNILAPFEKNKINQSLDIFNSNEIKMEQLEIINIKKAIDVLTTDMTNPNGIIIKNIDKNNVVHKCGIKLRKIIQYNCKMRLLEGYAINHSLRKMREDIKQIIKNTIKESTKQRLPIMYYKDSIPYMSNNTYFLDKYSEFRNLSNDEHYEYGKIFDIISNNKYGGMDLKKTNFMFITVINITDNTNIPPNPPYINITNLQYNMLKYDRCEKLNILMGGEDDKIREIAKKIINKIKNYSYYKDQDIVKNLSSITSLSLNNIKQLIELISVTNPLSLVGTLETSTIIKNPFLNYTIGTDLSIGEELYNNFFTKYGFNAINEMNLYDVTNEIKSLDKLKQIMIAKHISYADTVIQRMQPDEFRDSQKGGHKKRKNTQYYIDKILNKK